MIDARANTGGSRPCSDISQTDLSKFASVERCDYQTRLEGAGYGGSRGAAESCVENSESALEAAWRGVYPRRSPEGFGRPAPQAKKVAYAGRGSYLQTR